MTDRQLRSVCTTTLAIKPGWDEHLAGQKADDLAGWARERINRSTDTGARSWGESSKNPIRPAYRWAQALKSNR